MDDRYCARCLHLGYHCDLDSVQTRCPGDVCTDCDHATREANQVEGIES